MFQIADVEMIQKFVECVVIGIIRHYLLPNPKEKPSSGVRRSGFRSGPPWLAGVIVVGENTVFP